MRRALSRAVPSHTARGGPVPHGTVGSRYPTVPSEDVPDGAVRVHAVPSALSPYRAVRPHTVPRYHPAPYHTVPFGLLLYRPISPFPGPYFPSWFHIAPCHSAPCHTLLPGRVSRHAVGTVSYRPVRAHCPIVPSGSIPYSRVWFHMVPYRPVPYRNRIILSGPVSWRTVPYRPVSAPIYVLYRLAPYRTVRPYIAPWCAVLSHPVPYCATPSLTAPLYPATDPFTMRTKSAMCFGL